MASREEFLLVNDYDKHVRTYSHRKVKVNQRNKNTHKGVSLLFCWFFGFIVCLTFGLASFLMISAGQFSFSPSSGGVGTAWGNNESNEENFVTGNLIKVEVTELEAVKSLSQRNEEIYAQARNNMMEEFGPLPKYLSDYESIKLTVEEDGTKMPEPEEGEDIDVVVEKNSTSPSTEPNEQQEVLFAETGTFWREHIVKNGETLSDIALAHGNITAQDILRANGLKDANRLAENQLLLIPNDPGKIEDTLDEVRTRQMRVAATKEKVEPLKIKSYVVAQGDSLWSISNAQNIELDTLIGSNTFKTSAKLRPGATLRIPNQDGIFYVMKKDETIEEVSKRYGVSMGKVRQVNFGVELAALKTGDEIFLPGAKPVGLVENRGDNTKLAEAKKINSKNMKGTMKTGKLADGEVAVKNHGGFRWPIMGRITSPFGWRQHPITKRRDFHTGVDIKANRNDPIKAAGSGRIVYSGWMGGYGKVIVIEHSNGQSTLYAHCSSLLVGKGANVSSGQLVAKVGTTGRSTGPHLHFEVRNGKSPVNPIKYLTK